MNSRSSWIGAAVVALLMACGGAPRAPRMPSGEPYPIVVYTQKGIQPDMPPDRVSQLEQLGTAMEEDIMAILDNAGYAVQRVADPSQAQVGTPRYLLSVTVTNYNAGSKAARMLVGWGAGSAKLETHYELKAPDGSVLTVGDTSVASGRDWRNAVRKVNLQTVDAVNVRMRAL